MFENGVRDRWHKKGAADRDGALLMDMEGLVTQKEKIVRVEEAEGNYSDDDDGLGALKTLAEMSASLAPAGLLESESSPHWEEERKTNNVDKKSNTLETVSTSHHREKAKQAGLEDNLLHAISAPDKRKPKSVPESVDGNVVSIEELRTSSRKRKPKVWFTRQFFSLSSLLSCHSSVYHIAICKLHSVSGARCCSSKRVYTGQISIY
jgi:hypothetical protein